MRWQRRWFVLYDDGELTYSLDEHVSSRNFKELRRVHPHPRPPTECGRPWVVQAMRMRMPHPRRFTCALPTSTIGRNAIRVTLR
ncbi:unnamed protein product [Diatraea saccharalis]|uniref:PH domain-containing protein n=1 Tax=Diatraea saccharalis TaxID=40085 RepID=A0A9N9QVF5_9NEOP|nr:unnamed protein product [Diatraea saccharalis]